MAEAPNSLSDARKTGRRRAPMRRAGAQARQTLLRAAGMADWGRPPGETALGVSFAGYGDSMAAGIAEVAVDRDRGRISVPRFWAAVDAGLIIAPDNALAQIEGGSCMASAAR